MNLISMLLAAPLCGALLAALCGKRGKYANYTALAAEVLTLLISVLLLPSVLAGQRTVLHLPAVAGGGLSFAADGLRAVWAVLACFAFAMSGLVCPATLKHGHTRYQTATMLALCGTLGVFLAADLYTFFICFELMSLSSWLWVIHEGDAGAKYAADTYLAVTVLGGLVLLMGLFTFTIMSGGTPGFEELRQMDFSAFPAWMKYLAGGLMLFGFAAKAGLFPLHFWMPMAYPAAPATGSALLSSILTKCGVLGMLILSVTMFRNDFRWGETILALGVVTMLLGALLALCSVEVKRMLACSSASQIGFIAVGIGLMSLLGDENLLAVRGTMLHMVNHTLIKLILFLGAGVFAMNCGTLDLNRLRGAGRRNPLLALAFFTGAYSVAGIPGGSGYLSKTMLHEAIVEYTEILTATGGSIVPYMHLVEELFLLAGGLTLAYMLKLFVTLFLLPPETGKKPLRMNAATMAALAIPSALLWALGLAAHPLTDRILDIMQPALTHEKTAKAVAYFSTGNLTGACISIAVGIVVYFLVVRRLLTRDGKLINVVPGWCDLERKVYRPMFLRVLPGAAGLVCRLLDCSLDGVIVLLRRFVLRDLGRPRRPVAGLWLTDALGRFCDRVLDLINRTFRRKDPVEHRSYVYIFAEKEREIAASGRLIAVSLSFGMLLACAGLVATLLYLLF